MCDVYSSGWHIDNKTFDASVLTKSEAMIDLVSDKYEYAFGLLLKLGDTSANGKKADTPMLRIKLKVK